MTIGTKMRRLAAAGAMVTAAMFIAASPAAANQPWGWENPGGGYWVNNGDGSATINYPNGDRSTTAVAYLEQLGLAPVYYVIR